MNLVAQSVAIAAQRLDDGGHAVGVELAPQVADIDIDDIALAVELPAPHALGDLRAAQRLAGMAQKKLKHGILARRERDRLRAARRHPGAEIHRDVARDQPVAGAQDRPPQQTPPVERTPQLPYGITLHDQAVDDDQRRRLQRREDVRPDGRGDKAERKARHAGHEGAEKVRGDERDQKARVSHSSRSGLIAEVVE